MKRTELDGLSTDDLWSLHIELSQLLQQRIQQEKLQLEERLTQLQIPVSGRRPYPPVLPQYRNPDQPFRDLDRLWQAAALAGLAVEIEKAH